MLRPLARQSRRPLAAALFAAAFAVAAPAALGGSTPVADGVELYFITPTDGATVQRPVAVRFGLRGMGIAPAGVEAPRTGHHHLIVNAPLPPMDQPVPADAQHIHFGAGQTETYIDLPPGKHELQLLLGDHQHMPHDPPVVSERITITVE